MFSSFDLDGSCILDGILAHPHSAEPGCKPSTPPSTVTDLVFSNQSSPSTTDSSDVSNATSSSYTSTDLAPSASIGEDSVSVELGDTDHITSAITSPVLITRSVSPPSNMTNLQQGDQVTPTPSHSSNSPESLQSLKDFFAAQIKEIGNNYAKRDEEKASEQAKRDQEQQDKQDAATAQRDREQLKRDEEFARKLKESEAAMAKMQKEFHVLNDTLKTISDAYTTEREDKKALEDTHGKCEARFIAIETKARAADEKAKAAEVKSAIELAKAYATNEEIFAMLADLNTWSVSGVSRGLFFDIKCILMTIKSSRMRIRFQGCRTALY